MFFFISEGLKVVSCKRNYTGGGTNVDTEMSLFFSQDADIPRQKTEFIVK